MIRLKLNSSLKLLIFLILLFNILFFCKKYLYSEKIIVISSNIAVSDAIKEETNEYIKKVKEEPNQIKSMFTTVPKANIRSGPSESYKVLFYLEKWTKVKIIGEKGNWLKIRISTDTKEGWIHKKLLSQKRKIDTALTIAAFQLLQTMVYQDRIKNCKNLTGTFHCAILTGYPSISHEQRIYQLLIDTDKYGYTPEYIGEQIIKVGDEKYGDKTNGYEPKQLWFKISNSWEEHKLAIKKQNDIYKEFLFEEEYPVPDIKYTVSLLKLYEIYCITILSGYSEAWSQSIKNRYRSFNAILDLLKYFYQANGVYETLEEEKIEIKNMLKQLKNEKSFELLLEGFAICGKLHDLCLSPSGSLLSFNNNVNTYHSEFQKVISKLEIMVP